MEIVSGEKLRSLLSREAYVIYSNLDPLDVVRHSQACYSLHGLIELNCVSIRTLNRVLERVCYSCVVV